MVCRLIAYLLPIVFVLAPVQAQPLIVAIKEAPPFVVKSGEGGWSGPAVALWQHAASELEQPFELREMSLDAMLAAVEKGEVDAAVGALSVTAARESRFDFTHPFHTTGFGIATRTVSAGGPLALVSRLVSKPFLTAAGTLVLLLFLTGLVVFMLERRANPEQFGGGWRKGLGSGFWWSAVTMTTVGYGDKAPRTAAGRTVAVLWMFAAVITISGFTASIASSLTLEQLTAVTGPDDLDRARVGTVGSSSSEEYLRTRRIQPKASKSLAAAMERLSAGELDAVVYDLPLLAHLLEQNPEWNHIAVLPGTLTIQQYAIAVPTGSKLREPLNQIIPAYTSTPAWRAMVQDY